MNLHSITPDAFKRRTAVGFIVLIWILAPYFLVQQFAIYPPITIPEPFDSIRSLTGSYSEIALYLYLSYGLLLGLAGYYSPPPIFVRYLKAICLVALISHLTFFFLPSQIDRVDLSEKASPLYHWLISIDKPRNCLPSLHASLAALSAIALYHRHTILGILATIWVGGIYWSALCLSQHVSTDLLAGLLLAIAVWFSVRRWTSNPAKS